MKTESYYKKLVECRGLKVQVDALKTTRKEWQALDLCPALLVSLNEMIDKRTMELIEAENTEPAE